MQFGHQECMALEPIKYLLDIIVQTQTELKKLRFRKFNVGQHWFETHENVQQTFCVLDHGSVLEHQAQLGPAISLSVC